MTELPATPLESAAVTLVVALLLDALFGEPPNAIHPVAWLGRALGALERTILRHTRSRLGQLCGGGLLTLAAVGIAVGVPSALLVLSGPWGPLLFAPLVLTSTFALRALGEAGTGMRRALDAGGAEAGRPVLGHLCSRDPSDLDSSELAAATVESLAENLSDSFVAPLFWYAVLGLPGALAYRAVNTLDAMVGYRGRYEWLGKIPARLDDALNLVPARLTALALLAAGVVHGARVRNGWRTWRRDGRRTESPNAGLPMATMAGLLGVRLTKRGAYALGSPDRPIDASTIDEAWRLARTAGWMVAWAAVLLLALASPAGRAMFGGQP